MAHKTETETDATKITNQFRSRTGFVYDLKSSGVRLTLNISQKQNSADPDEWCVDARVSSTPEAAPIEAWAGTRIDALREVGRLWTTKGVALGLPTCDWDGVATALAGVRAV
jgi:hypothetical protein